MSADPGPGPRVAVCFFGITRSLETTLPSILEFVVGPARAIGDTRLFAHLYDVGRIENERSGESSDVARGEHELLSADWLRLEAPGACLAERGFSRIASFGDFWDDDNRSLRNLVHQLHSLDVVTDAALAWEPDVVVFCRPDLRYLDSLAPWLAAASHAQEDTVFLPSWQHWGGYNDRFSVCSSPRAAAAWGKRIESAIPYLEAKRRPLHSERLLAWRLRLCGVRVELMPARAVRVRAGGRELKERFAPGWTDVPIEWFWGVVRSLKRAARRSPSDNAADAD